MDNIKDRSSVRKNELIEKLSMDEGWPTPDIVHNVDLLAEGHMLEKDGDVLKILNLGYRPYEPLHVRMYLWLMDDFSRILSLVATSLSIIAVLSTLYG